MLRKINRQRMQGFTLIELLIVMAVLGVLAVVVLIAINPAEQLRRARDSGRISGVQQLGRASSAYFVAQGVYPGLGATWIGDMVTTQDLASVPDDPTNGGAIPSTCTAPAQAQSGWCYNTGTDANGNDQAVVYTQLEANQYVSVCGATAPYAVFSTFEARGGWGCGEPPAAAAYTFQ